jgi:hypothetical protein
MTDEIKTTKLMVLLQKAIAEQGCDCQDCRGYAWDRVNEIMKKEENK